MSMSRRVFLYSSAAAAGSAVLAACSSSSSGGDNGSGGTQSSSAPADSGTPKIGGTVGSARKPLEAPASYHQAPALKGLPPIEKRLPDQPLVLPHNWAERGHYGGTMHIPFFGTTGMANASTVREFFYGLSPARYLNDGIDIGPGIADRWSSNKDASVWTVHFRTGLKWSDGELFDVEDILFWYEDIALPGHDAQTPPPDCLSAKGTPCTMKRVDQNTLRITFDSPQPLMPDYLAAWVKGNIGQNGPAWMYPKHYLKQFHPKYNPDVPKSWDATGGLWEQKADWMRNPDCPTLTGWRCKTWNNNSGVTLERNPYYYVVTKDGDQLPYLDTVQISLVQDAQVVKLQVQEGRADFCFGYFNQIDLADVSTLTSAKERGNYKILLWDSGSGTGSVFFLNLDYPDKKYRDLFNDKRFRRAISHAFDRKTARKTLYFQTGELTTGTMSPKAIEFLAAPDGPKMYRSWRDSAISHDIGKARSLLADIGLKDTDGDGYVEFPDGSKLTVEIPYSADISATEGAKDDQLVSDAKKIGLRMKRRPIPAQSFGVQWANGQLMSFTNNECSDGPNFLVHPQWVVPLDTSWWAPLQGMYYAQLGTPKAHTEKDVDPWKRHPPRRAPEPGSPVDRLTKLYNQTKLEPDEMKRHELVWKMIRIHIDEGPFFMGPVANFPQVMTHNVELKNVPDRDNLAQHGFVNPWIVPCPAVYDPECWFWANPDEHT
ncbi:MAG TPA: ABC transporter substrate-binding protein [Mycobacteriales bacterium]|nr:ABC transporter substrate-binding protein [Mycobacteriales bacterium]